MVDEVLGKSLARARLMGAKLETYPGDIPASIAGAYAVQEVMARTMETDIVGWKVGATSRAAQEALGVDEPFCGPLFDGHVHPSPAAIKVSGVDLRIVEPEIGFRMGRHLEPSARPRAPQDVIASIASVHPVIELANKRLPGTARDDVRWLIADGALNQALIVGDGMAFDAGMDMAAETVRVEINDQQASTGIGANALGNPLDVVLWLANHLSTRGIALKAGDWISTGLVCDMLTPEPGARIVAEFRTIGTVALELG